MELPKALLARPSSPIKYSNSYVLQIAYIYNVDAGNLGAKTGFVFMGTGIVFTAISWWLIPDTAGLTVEEVDWLYSRKVSAQKFKEHAGGDEVTLRKRN